MVWSILFAIGATKVYQQIRKQMAFIMNDRKGLILEHSNNDYADVVNIIILRACPITVYSRYLEFQGTGQIC